MSSKEELERKDRVIASLKKVIAESEKSKRKQEISSILSGVKFLDEQQKAHFTEIWNKSDVSVQDIAKVYNDIQTAKPYSKNSMYK